MQRMQKGASVAQSSKRRPPTTEVMGSSPVYRTSDRTWEEFVNTLPKVVSFLRVLRFPPTGENLTGWVRIDKKKKNCKNIDSTLTKKPQ